MDRLPTSAPSTSPRVPVLGPAIPSTRTEPSESRDPRAPLAPFFRSTARDAEPPQAERESPAPAAGDDDRAFLGGVPEVELHDDREALETAPPDGLEAEEALPALDLDGEEDLPRMDLDVGEPTAALQIEQAGAMVEAAASAAEIGGEVEGEEPYPSALTGLAPPEPEPAEPAEARPPAELPVPTAAAVNPVYGEVADRLESIARALRSGSPSALLAESNDPLSALIAGYVLGIANERRGR